MVYMKFHLQLVSNLIYLILFAAVTSTAQLMGCSSQELMTALCSHKIQSDEDTIAKNLTLRQVCLLFYYLNISLFYSLTQNALFSIYMRGWGMVLSESVRSERG